MLDFGFSEDFIGFVHIKARLRVIKNENRPQDSGAVNFPVFCNILLSQLI